MAVDFSKSKTRENLMRAFAGESQARNRYTIAAKQASRDNLYSISQIFLFTADQERAHAEVFYELLRGQTEQTIEICGGYPVNLAENVTDLLKSAVHNEMQEFEDVYPEFAKIAKEEGFDKIAYLFEAVGKIEKEHEKHIILSRIREIENELEDLKQRKYYLEQELSDYNYLLRKERMNNE